MVLVASRNQNGLTFLSFSKSFINFFDLLLQYLGAGCVARNQFRIGDRLKGLSTKVVVLSFIIALVVIILVPSPLKSLGVTTATHILYIGIINLFLIWHVLPVGVAVFGRPRELVHFASYPSPTFHLGS